MKAIYCLHHSSFDLIYGPEEQEAISNLVEIISPVQSADEIRDHLPLLSDVEILISGWGGPVLDRATLEAAPKLKAVFYGAGSVKYMLTEEFWSRDIAITSAYAANAVPVVEFALSQILFGLKSGWQQVREYRIEKVFTRLPMAGGYGSTVGLVSLGMIGKMVAERLKTFDLKVIAYDPFVKSYPEVEMVSLEELFQRSDVISVHTPWLKETEGLITGALLRQMKPYSTFLNTSRGAIVREDEMIDVMTERTDLIAMVDVTYPEPPDPDSPLFTLTNVIITPHIAGAVGPECRRLGQVMVAELKRFIAGEPLMYGLTRDNVAIMA